MRRLVLIRGSAYRILAIWSIVMFAIGALYARYYRYSILRPLWYISGSEVGEELVRDSRARFYLSSYREVGQRVFSPGQTASLCVVIPSPARPKEYIFRVLAALTSSTRRALNDVSVHAAVIQLSDNDLCNRIGAFSESSGLVCLTREEAANSIDSSINDFYIRLEQFSDDDYDKWVLKQRYDFAIAFSYCGQVAPQADVILMEDDGTFSDDGIEQTIRSVRLLKTTQPQWNVIRLYSSDFWEGWEAKHFFLLAPFSIICGFGLGFVHTKLSLPLSSHRLMTCVFWSFWVFFWMLILGKQHLPIIGTQTTGGVIPTDMNPRVRCIASVYEKTFAKELSKALLEMTTSRESSQVELYINNRVSKGAGFELLPNVVDHVGYVSSADIKNTGAGLSSGYWYPHHVRSGSFHRSARTPF